jgi:two-component system OmpR family sensor kinase
MFLVAILTTLIATSFMVFHLYKQNEIELFFKARLIKKELPTRGKAIQEVFDEFELSVIRGKLKNRVMKHGKTMKQSMVKQDIQDINNPFNLCLQQDMLKEQQKIVLYRGYHYLFIDFDKGQKLLLKDNKSLYTYFVNPLFYGLAVLLFLSIMYWLLRGSLRPLRELQRDIELYGEGKLEKFEITSKQDEVSLVANAFYKVVEKLQHLKASRTLFVRNIFHELNTPVTKGKLIAEIVEDEKLKPTLESIFTRLNVLLKELAQVEQITSQSMELSKVQIPLYELLDEARELLFIEEEIPSNIEEQMIEADFTMMSLVFKNLIDNAYKYGENLEIDVKQEGSITFISEGTPLRYDLSHYTEAFSRGDGLQNTKGFGLGLYIVSEILQKHGMQLTYSHEKGKNKFSIEPLTEETL